MRNTYILTCAIITTSLIFTACGEKEPQVYGEGETGEVINHAQTNCENSGGTYSDESCACPEEFTYNEKSGFCNDAEGAPGGTLGAELKGEANIEM